MSPNERPRPWPARLIDTESAAPEPELQARPELEVELQSVLRAWANEPGPSEEVIRRAARQAVDHFEVQQPITTRSWKWPAFLRSGRIALALAAVLLVPIGAALASKLLPARLSRLGDWFGGRHAIRSSETPSQNQIPSPPALSTGDSLRDVVPEVVAPPAPSVMPVARPERPTHRAVASAAPARLAAPDADLLAGEASLVSQAIALANSNPRAALDLLSDYWHQFPDGSLRGEAAIAELSARLSLGEQAEALVRLDGFARDDFRGMKGTAEELRVARLELMAGAGRCGEALPLLEKELSVSAAAPRLRGRVLLAHAACKASSGDEAGNRADLKRYLIELPDGPRAAQVRHALGQ